MTYVIIFCAAVLISLICTFAIRKVAFASSILDIPKEGRKIHTRPIPLLGGVGIYCAFLIIIGYYLAFAPSSWPSLTDTHVSLGQTMGILLGGLFLIIGGALDDKYNLKPTQQIIWPLLAIVAVIISGVGIHIMTNPFFGGVIQLDQQKVFLFSWDGISYFFTVWMDILTTVWLLTAIYTTKFLDGIDGLVAGTTVIGALIIGFFSLFFFVSLPTALLSFIVAGVFFGFLLLNFNPASIFLGEAGSTFAGFMLGVLAIISGAKFAVALLILGMPILDAAWVIFRRTVIEKRSPFVGDRKHLHFRLLDAGFSQRQVVCIIYALSASFGGAALFLQSAQKKIALLFLIIIMIIVGFLIVRAKKKITSI